MNKRENFEIWANEWPLASAHVGSFGFIVKSSAHQRSNYGIRWRHVMEMTALEPHRQALKV